MYIHTCIRMECQNDRNRSASRRTQWYNVTMSMHVCICIHVYAWDAKMIAIEVPLASVDDMM